MNEVFPGSFIGRDRELLLIRDLIAAPWGSRRVLLVHGPGGIGKTRLLLEIYRHQIDYQEEYVHLSTHHLSITGIFDFDALALRIPFNLREQFVEQLGREYFREYEIIRDTYVRGQLRGADQEWLQDQERRAERRFLDCFNKLASEIRVVILLDTLEEIQGTEVWRYLWDLIGGLDNVVVIAAGRRLKDFYPELESRLGSEESRLSELQPFSKEEATDYFSSSTLGREVSTDMREKIYLLTGGHPILMALALEWLRRDMPLNGIMTLSLRELQKLDEVDLKQKQDEFEIILVNKILDLTTVDQALLYMAHVYLHFSDTVLKHLLDLSEEEARRLGAELRDFPFVKARPRGGYTLHDEMRSLVLKHSWQKVDPHGTLRRQLSQKMVSYYDQRLLELEKSYNEAVENITLARQQEDTESARQPLWQLSEIERQRAVLQVERFHYLLGVDLGQAYLIFERLFDDATKRFDKTFRGLLWAEIGPYREHYTGEQKYQIGIRGAKYLLDATDYDQSHAIAEQVLKEFGDQNPEWRVEALVQMANCDARRSNMTDARRHFEDALDVSKKNNLRQWIGRVQSGLGWVYRLTGHWGAAQELYEQATELSKDTRDIERIAQLLNNLGYVRALLGNHQEGLNLCKQALGIWQELKRPRAEASVESTTGEIFVMLENYPQALISFDNAMRFFKEEEDWEWIAIQYHQRAYCKWLEDEPQKLEEAREDLQESLRICREHNIVKELPIVLHRLGHVSMTHVRLIESRKYFEDSLEVSEKIQDYYRLVDNLVGLAEISLMEKRFEEIEAYVRRIEEIISEQDVVFPFLQGRAFRLLGDAFVEQREYEKAHNAYCDAYPMMAQHGGYGMYRLSQELVNLRAITDSLPKNLAVRWYETFWECWNEKVRGKKGESELLNFCLLQRVRAENRQ